MILHACSANIVAIVIVRVNATAIVTAMKAAEMMPVLMMARSLILCAEQLSEWHAATSEAMHGPAVKRQARARTQSILESCLHVLEQRL